MSDQDIPEALQNRVMDFYEFIWNKNKWVWIFHRIRGPLLERPRSYYPERPVEWFSSECRKTQTKVIMTTNQKTGKYPSEPMRTQTETEAQENASDQIVIGFSSTSDWLRARRDTNYRAKQSRAIGIFNFFWHSVEDDSICQLWSHLRFRLWQSFKIREISFGPLSWDQRFPSLCWRHFHPTVTLFY